ncbi:unnamed protein product [Didymodactylos carnosus]|uniref:G patch domain-containing protein 11 n=1 Tax=Didymodactylos carnosus TaxID=1234261 RepID=A0A813V6V2_9BILA|nr:unnamed protein product [Didymodactylos carnosus]CAF0835996.1 unnamed protein product [Didymodactylos carnosus]CAF3541512.1 unnamed protein product [Didymodactylos carnosus]CAF3623232.1 unnamed protein product [Didymodactylos carnosus]
MFKQSGSKKLKLDIDDKNDVEQQNVTEEEDDDYMSDAHLAVADKLAGPQSLNHKRLLPTNQRSESVQKQEKPRRLLEQEQREQGLTTAITNDNKGFQLLKKMGYREGTKLGRETEQKGGLIEPLTIKIHTSRTGLGQETKEKEIVQKRQENVIKRENNIKHIQSTFQDRMKQKFHNKRLQIDINKCQTICERLDKEIGLTENILWKKQLDEIIVDNEVADDGDESEEQFDLLDLECQLERLTSYLREKHFYCLWCGVMFSDEEELEQLCPGDNADAH